MASGDLPISPGSTFCGGFGLLHTDSGSVLSETNSEHVTLGELHGPSDGIKQCAILCIEANSEVRFSVSVGHLYWYIPGDSIDGKSKCAVSKNAEATGLTREDKSQAGLGRDFAQRGAVIPAPKS